ncbi:MAG: hypothetical protein ABSA44_11525 [Bacteroidota bacterium]|jgi:hypothetical protein
MVPKRKLQTISEVSSIGGFISTQILGSKLNASLSISVQTLNKLNSLDSRIGQIEKQVQEQYTNSEKQRMLREAIFQIRSFLDNKFQVIKDNVVRYVTVKEVLNIFDTLGLSSSSFDEIRDKQFFIETATILNNIFTSFSDKDKTDGDQIIKSQNMLNKLRSLFAQLNTQLANIQTADTHASTIGSIILVLISGCNFMIYFAVSEETFFSTLGIISALFSIPFIWGWIKYTLKKQDLLEDLSSRVRGLGLAVGYPRTQKVLAIKLQSSIKQCEQEMESFLQEHPEFTLIEVKI